MAQLPLENSSVPVSHVLPYLTHVQATVHVSFCAIVHLASHPTSAHQAPALPRVHLTGPLWPGICPQLSPSLRGTALGLEGHGSAPAPALPPLCAN